MPSFYGITQKFNEGDENLYFAQLTTAISAVLSIRMSLSGSMGESLRSIGVVVGRVSIVTLVTCSVE